MISTTYPFADNLDGETVAAYETVHGASLATEQLEQAGFAAEDVAILPVATRPLPDWSQRVTQRTHPRSVVVAALVGFGVALIATFRWTESSAAISTFASVVSGLGCGAAAMLVDAQRVAAVRGRARSERRVIAERFEVRCTRDAGHARHILARWWNAEAVPTRSFGRG